MPVADPDFQLRWGPGFGLLALPAFLPSVISSFFTQNKGGPGPLGPSPRSATVCSFVEQKFNCWFSVSRQSK